jgi:hypothetical protein
MSSSGKPAAPAARVPLNPFQTAMLLWEDSHPYNAAHVVRVRGPADVAAWRRAVEAAAGRAGLGRLVIDRARASCSLEPAGPIEVRTIERGKAPAVEALWEAVRADMNAPFPGGPHHPVRWSIVDDSGSGSHYLAAVYRHVAADATSMGAIIGDAVRAHAGLGPRAAGAAVLDAGAGAARAAPRGRLRALARAARVYFRLRRAHRMRLRKDAGEDTGFIVVDPAGGLLRRLSAAAKERGATVNDAFLAALASALAAATPERRARPARRALGIGIAAALRAEPDRDGDLPPGVRVGQAVIVIGEPDEPRLDVLLERVAALARAEKDGGAFTATPWSLLALSRLKRWLPRQGARAWYRKVYPIAAGISNVRWRADAFGGERGGVLAHHRILPPGPALPLAVAPTTLGESLTFSFSHHLGSLAEDEVKTIAAAFVARLEALAGP